MASIVLVPGFWLGAWAWDDVAAALREDGHAVTAVTLPGLESFDADRSRVTMEDHVTAICEAIGAAGEPVILAVHSGAGFPGYAATDRMPDLVANAVYVDSGPGKGAMNPDFVGDWPLPSWQEMEDDGNSLEGLSDHHLEEFRRRGVPQPGATMREAVELTNEARLDVPTTVICTSFSSAEIKEAAEEGYEWLQGLLELRDVTWVDLPTGHWPMWSRPQELAAIISDIATGG
jgi:pimeloyl-ACP methyl ester carboxylesterase